MNATLEKDKIEIIKWVAGLKGGVAMERLKLLKKNPKKIDWWDQISADEQSAIAKDEDKVFGEILKKSKRSGRLNEKETKVLVAAIR